MTRFRTPLTAHKHDGRAQDRPSHQNPSNRSKPPPRAVPRPRTSASDSFFRMFGPKAGTKKLRRASFNIIQDETVSDPSGDEDEGSEDSAGSDDSEEWDEEETLYDMVQPECAPKGEDDTASTLINALSPAFARASEATKQSFIDALLPAMLRLREEIPPMSGTFDRQCAQNMKEVRDACALFEEMDLAAEDGGDDVDANKRFKDIFTELQAHYKKRDEIETRRRALVQEKMEHLRARIHALPADMERLIDKVFKKAKELDKADAAAAQMQKKKLQALLHKA